MNELTQRRVWTIKGYLADLSVLYVGVAGGLFHGCRRQTTWIVVAGQALFALSAVLISGFVSPAKQRPFMRGVRLLLQRDPTWWARDDGACKPAQECGEGIDICLTNT